MIIEYDPIAGFVTIRDGDESGSIRLPADGVLFKQDTGEGIFFFASTAVAIDEAVVGFLPAADVQTTIMLLKALGLLTWRVSIRPVR